MNRIFAVVGMAGSGKSVACDVLKRLGWGYIRFGQLTIDSLREQGKPINEENEKAMREELRRRHGMGAFALLLLPAIEAALEGGHVVIDGLYSWSEYTILKEKFPDRLDVVHIYASPRIRYRRLDCRSHDPSDRQHRMRRLSPEQARLRDHTEIENIEKAGPIAMADFTVLNERSLGHLRRRMRKLASGAGGM